MLHQRRAEKRHRQRAIPRAVQTAAHRVGQPDRHHFAQIAAADLIQRQLVHATRQAVILTVDHAENRIEENYEKIND